VPFFYCAVSFGCQPLGMAQRVRGGTVRQPCQASLNDEHSLRLAVRLHTVNVHRQTSHGSEALEKCAVSSVISQRAVRVSARFEASGKPPLKCWSASMDERMEPLL